MILEENPEDMALTAFDDDDSTVVYIGLLRGSFEEGLNGGEMAQRVVVREDLGGVGTDFESWEDASAVHFGL